MKMRILTIALMALLLASCGSSNKGPGGQITPPTPPTTGPGPAPGPQPPVVPGFGTGGKLTMHVEEGGRVTTNPDVGTCGGRADCEFRVRRGTIITLTAIPDEGWVFEEWDNCPGPSGLQCILTVDALTYVKAEFDPAP
jgi:hypothetical protein